MFKSKELVPPNIFNEFKIQTGYINATNQYIETILRVYKRDYSSKQIEEVAKDVGMKISSIPEDLEVRISKQYIIGINSSLELFLNNFRELPGSPTYGKNYNAKNDGSKLSWTIKWCFDSPDKEIKNLESICEYYRMIRNKLVHLTNMKDSDLAQIKGTIHLSEDELECKVFGRLSAPNDFENIGFDDQVLFSRAAFILTERIFYESKYDWQIVLEKYEDKIKRITRKVLNNDDKRTSRIVKYLEGIYPIHNDDNFKLAVIQLKK